MPRATGSTARKIVLLLLRGSTNIVKIKVLTAESTNDVNYIFGYADGEVTASCIHAAHRVPPSEVRMLHVTFTCKHFK